MRATRAALAAMSLDEFRKLHPTASQEVLEALYDDRLVAFDENGIDDACPICGGELKLLGKLGQRVHQRCRACGSEFSEEVN